MPNLGKTNWIGLDLKSSHSKVFEKGMKMHMVSHIKVCSSTTYHIFMAEFGELPIDLYGSQAHNGLSTMACPRISFLAS